MLTNKRAAAVVAAGIAIGLIILAVGIAIGQLSQTQPKLELSQARISFTERVAELDGSRLHEQAVITALPPGTDVWQMFSTPDGLLILTDETPLIELSEDEYMSEIGFAFSIEMPVGYDATQINVVYVEASQPASQAITATPRLASGEALINELPAGAAVISEGWGLPGW